MTRPTAVSVNVAGIPDALKIETRWVCWRYLWSQHEGKQGRWIKLPCNPNGRAAKPNDPSTWTTFDAVLAGRFDGIGFCLGDGWAGIDLDDCVDAAAHVIPDAAATVARLDTLAAYYELSPSGSGLKVIGRSARYGGEIKFPGPVFTTWAGARFCALTGAVWSHADIATPLTNLTAVIDNWFPLRSYGETRGPLPAFLRVGDTRGTETMPRLTDDQVVSQILATPQADKFVRLVRGDVSDYGGDHSRADQALATILAYWCQGDLEQVDRLFRQTALMRPKWNTASYRRATLSKAVRS